MKSIVIAGASLLALAACGGPASTPAVGEKPATVATEPAQAASAVAGGMSMTPEDPGGFTVDGFTFHTRPGAKHVVRLEAPGTDTWKATAAGEPTVKPLGERRETTPEGKAALVLEFEAIQSGNVAIEFQRLEDGEVEGTRTINFMVH